MPNLTEGKEGRTILAFAAPMLIGNVFQQFYNVVDSIVVGRFVGKEALAAVGSSFSITFLLVALIMGVTMGSGIMIAQFYGAGDRENVKKTISTTYVYVLTASVVLGVAGLAGSPALLRLLGTPPEVLPQAVSYLRILLAGLIPVFGYNALTAVFRAVGDSRTPLIYLIVATLTNVALDVLFVVGFGWGVAGAAWATIISQTAAFLLSYRATQRSPHEVLHLDLRHVIFDRKLFARSMSIGIPTGIQQALVAMGMMALTRIVNGFGTDALAAYTAAGRLDTFAGMPALNFSLALVTFVGQNLGAGKPDRVRRGLRATLLMSGGTALVISAVMVTFRTALIAVFNTDPAVVAIGSRYLVIVGTSYVLFAAMFVVQSVPRGAGDTLVPMLVTLLALWVIRVPASWLLSRRLGTDGIWAGMPIAWLVGGTLNTIYYFRGRWKTKVVTRALTGDEPADTQA